MLIENFAILNTIYENKVPTDEEVIENLKRIGLTENGNMHRIEKNLRIAVNDFDTLNFDETREFDKRVKESILSAEGQHSTTKLSFNL